MISYDPKTSGLPFEAFSLDSLIERRGASELAQLQRIEFDLVIVCTRGRGEHEVDFERTTLDASRIVHVRPGQVHRWILEPSYQATIVLLQPLEQQREWRRGPSTLQLSPPQAHDLAPVIALATHTWTSDMQSIRSLEATRELLVSCLGLDTESQAAISAGRKLYEDFRRLLQASDKQHQPVAHYAAQLACSTRTLARVCHDNVGATPKQIIDQEVCLTAQRLLSLPGSSVTSVAGALQFGDVSNFTRFFKRTMGEAPLSWLKTLRSGADD